VSEVAVACCQLAPLVGERVALAAYRKAHLWDRESLFFEPGAEGPPVVETEHGRIGTMLRYDLEFRRPEPYG
jgi:predicted amidohydrolase